MRSLGLAPFTVQRINETKDRLAKIKPRALPWKKKGLSRAERVIRFCEWLPITKGPLCGQQMKLMDFQKEFIREVYGRTREDGRRQVRLGIQSIARGNGKTALCAALVLCHLMGPESEPRGAVFSAAVDRQQAALVYDECVAILLAVDELGVRANIIEVGKKIIILDGDGAGSRYEAMPADDRRAHGLSPSMFVFDELAQCKDRKLLDGLMSGLGKRSEALGLVISTQAADHTHPLSTLIDAAEGDPTTYVQLICADDTADPFDIKTIRACNPALGTFLDEGEAKESAERARRIPAFENAFRNLRLNQRVSLQDEQMLLSRAVWELGAAPVDEAALLGKPCEAGLDLAQTLDLAALVLPVSRQQGRL
jgi:phage terminase large subunit-like protein